jgi:hypothetical protein
MANIKLGAIITDIAGSVSGSTFRRTPAGIILYNKQGTQIKSAFAQASQKNAISNVFRGWNILSSNVQKAWNDVALLYPVPGKFGGTKFLTGRQLYTKVNTQLLPTGTSSDVESFNTYVEAPEVVIDFFSIDAEELNISYEGSFASQYILISAYLLRPNGNPLPHKHFKRFYVELTGSGVTVNIYTDFIQEFPLVSGGQTYGFNIQFMNTSGIISSVQATTKVVGL